MKNLYFSNPISSTHVTSPSLPAGPPTRVTDSALREPAKCNGLESASEGRLTIAKRFQRRESCKATPHPEGTRELLTSPCEWWECAGKSESDSAKSNRFRNCLLSAGLLLAALIGAVACSREMPAAASKPPVTLDPDVFNTDHPELFKTAKAESRTLPTIVTANGVVTPD